MTRSSDHTALPSENWPKPFLLEAHSMAVQHGFVHIKPISQADAQSLRQRLYRIRRRSDTSTASFIPPEYHLVMVGAWEPEEGGRLPIIYNKRSDGKDLPSIVPVAMPEGVTLDEIEVVIRQEALLAPDLPKPVFEPPEDADLTLNAEEVSSFVDKMKRKVQGQ